MFAFIGTPFWLFRIFLISVFYLSERAMRHLTAIARIRWIGVRSSSIVKNTTYIRIASEHIKERKTRDVIALRYTQQFRL